MKAKHFSAALLVLLAALASNSSKAGTPGPFQEDFTGPTTFNNWYFLGGACLTAGTSTATSSPGLIPGCGTVLANYYNKAANADPYLVGGDSGFLGSATAPGSISGQVPDPFDSVNQIGYGALRFTNGSQNIGGTMKYGHNERGAILSQSTFPSDHGIQVTFKTVTYHGDSGGAGSDGADGISFFLQDGSRNPGFGAFGGSLAYSCANNNVPYDGLTGAYLGLGIDEYGNFLNGTNLVVGYTGTNTATGDNAAYGYGYKPGRIGLRGAGNISLAGLTDTTLGYGNDPGDLTKPFYPVSLNTSCSITGGTYSAASNNCINVCSTGSSYYAPGNVCNKACTGGGVYDSGTNTCQSCSSVAGTYNGGQCINTNSCSVGTYFSGTATCDTCPATGYATGTYSSGNCIRSCPTNYTYNGTVPGYCIPTGGAFNTTSLQYCPAGYVFQGTTQCYASGASHSTVAPFVYCPSGQTLNSTTVSPYTCYPNTYSQNGGYYCPSGQTILNGTQSCYPTGFSHSTSATAPFAYCPSGQTISSSPYFCYPAGSVYGTGHYCPTGNTISGSPGTHCCPSGYTWNTGSNICKQTSGGGTNAGTASTVAFATLTMTAAIPETAATADTAATAAPNSQTVPANQAATQNTTPVPSAPTTAAPTTGLVDGEYAVQNTCRTGNLYNYSTVSAPANAGPATLANPVNTKHILDYPPIPNAYSELTSFQIANESAATRSAATPIFYNLKITPSGLLSFGYSVSGGSYSYLIRNQSIITSNGDLPGSFRVGFAGSDGGASNIHEIMCFKAAPTNQSGSSATVNEKQAAKVEAGTQAYFALYNPDNWTGTVTANTLIDTGGTVTVATTANWDAGCLLNGTNSGATVDGGGCSSTNTGGPTAPSPVPASRVIFTWDTAGNVGIPFEWANLNTAQQNALTVADGNFTSNRLNYLRGDRSNEINATGAGLFRQRDSILGDIVDSSPNWVGPPIDPYTATWRDRIYGGTLPENSGTQSYLQFVAAEQTRLNVVYVGANDGLLHGFRAGSFDAKNNFIDSGSTPNDGAEVLAYIPGASLVSAAQTSAVGACTNGISSETLVQNIHGVTPAVGLNALCNDALIDYSNPQYGHNFYVDATPGSDDLFYGGQWHTWLVGGLGAGGNAIYALDVTNPDSSFSESNASNIVVGEWNPASITCANVSGCGNNLGNTFGTPQIRRLHNGNWAVIFGNGFGSASGDAGIYVMSVDHASGATTFYYLSTHTAGGNGIAYTTPQDLDGDHIVDYVYAGDLNGNVWRFDLTSNDPSQWAAASTPLFTTQSGQPITSQLLVILINTVGSRPRLLIEFGTGQRTQLNNLGPEQFASGTQSLYAVWDWNMAAWNSLQPSVTYASLDPASTGLSSPYVVSSGNLQAQTLSLHTLTTDTAAIDGTDIPVCWKGSSASCTQANNQFGWTMNLSLFGEQVIFNPVFFQGAFLVNTIQPANNVPTTCDAQLDKGYTYALNVSNGGFFPKAFPNYTNDSNAAGIETNAAGSVYVVMTAEGKSNIVYQKISGSPDAQLINIPSNIKAKRLTWIEQR